MPVHIQPASIRDLAMDRIVLGLIKACFGINSGNTTLTKKELILQARKLLRPFWCSKNLPSNLRREILKKCMDSLDELIQEGYLKCLAQSYVPVYLLNILLDTDIVDLRVRLCCYDECDHKNALLEVLATDYAKGLNSLELTRSKVSFFDPQLFQPIVISLSNNLTKLVLRNISNDEILKVIGQSCFHLVTLDISQSIQVTDSGIKDLLQYPVDGFEETQIQSTTTLLWNRVEHTFLNERSVNFLSGGTHIIDPESLQEYCQYPTKLCSTLQTLDISDTSVSRLGILRALLNVQNMKSFGEFTHVGNAIDLLNKCTIPSTKLELTIVNSCRTTSSKLQIICNTCTKLEKIIISDPKHSPFELCSLPRTLTKICLRGIPSNVEWLNGLYTFLSKPQSQILQELSLRFKNIGTLLTIDFGKFLFQLTNLEILAIHGIESTLQLNSLTVVLKKLEKIRLSQIDHPNSLQCLLKCTPNLTVLHVYNCLNLNNLNVIDLLNAGDTKQLKCFYINELPGGDTKTVSSIISVYPEITSIGNIRNWNVIPVEENVLSIWVNVNNYKLNFPGNFHWYYSECFPGCQVFL